jgi:hypothetical protein
MKSQQRANNYALLSSLIWGLSISLVSWSSRWFITDDKLLDVIWHGGNFLALILYPLLVSILLHKKTHLWINAFLFSAAGSMVSSIAMFSLRAFQGGTWTDLILGLLGIGLVGQVLIPRFEQIPALQSEWSSPLWENLNASSFIEFLFLQLYSINENAD